MQMLWMRWFASPLAAFIFAASLCSAAWADPPTRAGRIAEINGSAWLFDADAREWVRAIRNQTLAEGDHLRTDDRSRITIRVGSTSMWVDERSDLVVSQLNDERTHLQLNGGAIGLRLRSQEAVSELRVFTREGQIFAESEGLFRIQQLDRGTRVLALQGRIGFESDRSGALQRAWLREGEQSEFWWADGPRTEHQKAVSDSFGEWMVQRDRIEVDTGLASRQYVSPEMTGAEDLDRYGRWEESVDYGPLWIPTQVAVGWEPYRDGRWTWTVHWGWSWVDDTPWGFAPFHYGRWVQWRGRWSWVPGRYMARPVYAPAMVAWNGGAGVSIGINIGGRTPPHRGWQPLAPREVYVPAYKHSPNYAQRINRQNDPVTVVRPQELDRGRAVPVPAIRTEPSQGRWRSDAAERRDPVRDSAREAGRDQDRRPNSPPAPVPAPVPVPQVQSGRPAPAVQQAPRVWDRRETGPRATEMPVARPQAEVRQAQPADDEKERKNKNPKDRRDRETER